LVVEPVETPGVDRLNHLLQGPTMSVSSRLPDFPWDHLTEYAARARAHADGIVDLSVGTPVDPTPEVA